MNIAQPPIIMNDWLRELCGFDYDEYQGTFNPDYPDYEYLKKAIAEGEETREGYQYYLDGMEADYLEQMQSEPKTLKHLTVVKGGRK